MQILECDVAVGIYFGSGRGRRDSIMVENSEILEIFDVLKEISFWFEKVLLLP